MTVSGLNKDSLDSKAEILVLVVNISNGDMIIHGYMNIDMTINNPDSYK